MSDLVVETAAGPVSAKRVEAYHSGEAARLRRKTEDFGDCAAWRIAEERFHSSAAAVVSAVTEDIDGLVVALSEISRIGLLSTLSDAERVEQMGVIAEQAIRARKTVCRLVDDGPVPSR